MLFFRLSVSNALLLRIPVLHHFPTAKILHTSAFEARPRECARLGEARFVCENASPEFATKRGERSTSLSFFISPSLASDLSPLALCCLSIVPPTLFINHALSRFCSTSSFLNNYTASAHYYILYTTCDKTFGQLLLWSYRKSPLARLCPRTNTFDAPPLRSRCPSWLMPCPTLIYSAAPKSTSASASSAAANAKLVNCWLSSPMSASLAQRSALASMSSVAYVIHSLVYCISSDQLRSG